MFEGSNTWSECLFQVRKDAIEVVKMRKGDVNNDLDVQGEYLLQFSRYRGQSFRWMLENALGYAGWFVDNIRNEKVTQSAISQNKAAFKGYVESFEEGREVVAMKTKQREDKEVKIKEASLNSSPRKAASPLATAVLSGHLSTEKYVSRVISSGSAEKFKPTIPARKRVRKSASVTELPVASTSTENNTVTADDEELLAITVEFEKSLGKQTKTVVMFLNNYNNIALRLMFTVVHCVRVNHPCSPANYYATTSNNRACGK